LGQNYKRPPITEAVIELRFADQQPKDSIDKAAARIKRTYFHQEPISERSYLLNMETGDHQASLVFEGHKLSSMDRTEIVLIKTSAYSSSQLAPYVGWDRFVARAKGDWSEIRGVIGPKKINRVGVRYINRLDIPGALKKEIDPTEYLLAAPNLPTLDWKPLKKYLMQINRPETQGDPGVTLNSGIVPSPLVGHLSILLDIDVFRETEIPPDEDKLWTMIATFRDEKNAVFETSITDAARALFN